MSTKLLVLGMDAASPDLLMRWAREGKLPAIRHLLDRGLSGLVSGVEGFYIGSTWPSLYTGLNPAGHGFYRIHQHRAGSYDLFSPLETPAAVGGVPFWKIASDAGRRVAVLDVPLSRVDSGLNGVQVVEWGGHDVVFGFRCSSAATKRRVLANVGTYPLPSSCDGARTSAEDFELFLRTLESAIEKKKSITLDFLAREPWDLFVQVFTEAHCAGHQCWHIHDADHPAHDGKLRDALGDPLERIYTAIDRAVAAVLEQAGDARVLLFCAHGMGPYRGAPFLLAEILFRLGVTARPPAPRPRAGQPGAEGALSSAARRAWRLLPETLRDSLRPFRARLRAEPSDDDRMRALGADARASRCFPVPNGAPVGGIRLNLVGREPHGILQPGREAEEFCDELAKDLLAIIDERTGRPLIAGVRRTEALYEGPRRQALPDLLVEWSAYPATGTTALADGRGARIRATSPKIGTVDASNRYGRSGEHVPTGMFVCAGSGIAAASCPEPVSILDICPSICELLGLSAPRLDGVPIPGLVRPAVPAHR